MGIKFHCPNGHKLNVKSFLAGKRGICPTCHVRMRIPLESEESQGEAVVAEAAPKKVSARVEEPVASSTTATAAVAPDSQLDQLLQDPERVWHMTSAEGEQYGPAAGDEVRQWLADDRIDVDCHIWCDSWDDWRAAEQVFTGLADGSSGSAPALLPDEEAPFSDIDPFYLQDAPADSVVQSNGDNPFGSLIQTEPLQERTGGGRRSQQRKNKGASPARAAIMGVVALASLIALVFVIYRAFN